jgi:hypothetical protein
MTESYGVLTVGETSSEVEVGELVTGAGVLPLTAIDGNLSGSGAGSTWLVNNAQAVAPESMTIKAAPLTVSYKSIVGATANRDYFEVQPSGDFGFDYNPSDLSYARGAAAAALGLTRKSGALDSTPGGHPTSAAAYMNNVVQNENNQFGSFQATWTDLAQRDPNYLDALAAWAGSTEGPYRFLRTYSGATPPAGSSLPTTDPAGTYSAAGASAPTPDPAGTYSAAAGSAPTLAAAGTYILNTAAYQYGLNRLFLEDGNRVPLNEVLSFNSVTAVENYFGVTSSEATLATDFFAGYDGSSANMLLSGRHSEAAGRGFTARTSTA